MFLSLSLASPAQSKTAAPNAKPAAKAPAPNEDAQLYQNVPFGFRYLIPYGWVNRTQEMGDQKTDNHDTHNPDPRKPNTRSDDASRSKLLLAVFARPPEATGDTINSAVVIASESAASYPGLKKAEDYLGPLTELAAAKGLKPEGEPYELEVESRQLLRADFSKALAPGANGDQLSMKQCTLVLLTKGRIVSFTFIAGSED